MIFYIDSSTGKPNNWISGTNVWVIGEWRHVVWSLDRLNTTHANWRIYIDGKQQARMVGWAPENVETDKNWIGRTPIGNWYDGLVDSLYIYPMALRADEASLLYSVRCFFVVYMYVYVCVYVCIYIYIYIYDTGTCWDIWYVWHTYVLENA
jgi:hypothetical protein